MVGSTDSDGLIKKGSDASKIKPLDYNTIQEKVDPPKPGINMGPWRGTEFNDAFEAKQDMDYLKSVVENQKKRLASELPEIRRKAFQLAAFHRIAMALYNRSLMADVENDLRVLEDYLNRLETEIKINELKIQIHEQEILGLGRDPETLEPREGSNSI